jgi:hypothetical protein
MNGCVIAQSPNGRRQQPFYAFPFRVLLGTIAWFFSLLPYAPSLYLASAYVKSMNAAKHLIISSSTSVPSSPLSSPPSPTDRDGDGDGDGDLYLYATKQLLSSRRSGNEMSIGSSIVRAEQNTMIAVLSLLRSSIAHNALSMAREEMRDIANILTSSWNGHTILSQHYNTIYAIWSGIDEWAPLSYATRLLNDIPVLSSKWKGLHLDDKGLPHAFVVDDVASQTVARRLWSWILPHIHDHAD